MRNIFNAYRTIFISICFLGCSSLGWAAQNSAVPLDKVVAIVNSSVLTQNQLNETIETVKQQMQATGQPLPSAEVLRKKALDQAIGEMLQLQIAQRANIKVPDADVARAISQIAQQNNLSVEQLKDALEKQGIDYTHYRKQIQDQIIMHQLQQQALMNKVQVTDADVKAFLKKPRPNSEQTQYHLDDLLIPLPESADSAAVAAATTQAKELLEKARSGTSFTELAQNPVQRLDLQWRMAKDLPAVFVTAVNTLKTGEATGPIRAPNGLHLLRLLEVRGQAAPLTAAQAKQLVLQQKLQEQTEKWVRELRKSAYIKIM